jgi:hypothetical protein
MFSRLAGSSVESIATAGARQGFFRTVAVIAPGAFRPDSPQDKRIKNMNKNN